MGPFARLLAPALAGAVLLFAANAAAQVSGGVVAKPPFVNGDCVKAAGPGAIQTTGTPCAGGSGTVTSVDASGGTTGLTFSGGPITTSGTLILGGGLVVANGGTGAFTLTTNGVLYGNGTSAISATAAGTTGQVLIGNTGSAPSWSALSSLGVTSLSFGSTGLTPSTGTQGSITVAGTLDVDNGGTGQTTYLDGQLLIGNSVGNTLTKATLTAGSNVTITNGNGSITIAASGGGGSGCVPAGSATQVLTDSGAGACTSNAAFLYSAGTATLGTAGSVVGSVAFANATSGTVKLSPVAGALGTSVLTLPAVTDTVAAVDATQTLTNKSITTFSGALTFTPANANFTASPTGTGTVTISPATVGTFNNINIGATTAGTGRFSTLTATGAVTLSPANAAVALSPTGTGTVAISPAGALTVNPTAASTINNTSIGVTTAAAGRFTTLTTTGAVTLSPANAAVTASPTGTGTVTLNPATAGTINNMSIGQTTKAAGSFTTIVGTSSATLGVAAGTTGTVVLNGTTSGAVTISPQAAAGTYNFNLPTSAGTAGQPLLSGGGGGAAQTYGTLGVAAGGTGQTTYTDGQLLIGNTTGNTLAKSTLTAGSGISVTNGSGTITIAATGTAPAAPTVQATGFTAAANGQYCVNTTGGAITATLPASPANGDTILFLDCLQTWGTNNLTLGRNALTIMNIAQDLTVDRPNGNFHVTYVSTGGVTTWIMW